MGLIGLRVDTPHALRPLSIDDTDLLFTGRSERQNVWWKRKKKEEEGEEGQHEETRERINKGDE